MVFTYVSKEKNNTINNINKIIYPYYLKYNLL